MYMIGCIPLNALLNQLTWLGSSKILRVSWHLFGYCSTQKFALLFFNSPSLWFCSFAYFVSIWSCIHRHLHMVTNLCQMFDDNRLHWFKWIFEVDIIWWLFGFIYRITCGADHLFIWDLWLAGGLEWLLFERLL